MGCGQEGFNNLFLIGQYFGENSGAIGTTHGLFHSQVVGKRNICNIITCNPRIQLRWRAQELWEWALNILTQAQQISYTVCLGGAPALTRKWIWRSSLQHRSDCWSNQCDYTAPLAGYPGTYESKILIYLLWARRTHSKF